MAYLIVDKNKNLMTYLNCQYTRGPKLSVLLCTLWLFIQLVRAIDSKAQAVEFFPPKNAFCQLRECIRMDTNWAFVWLGKMIDGGIIRDSAGRKSDRGGSKTATRKHLYFIYSYTASKHCSKELRVLNQQQIGRIIFVRYKWIRYR